MYPDVSFSEREGFDPEPDDETEELEPDEEELEDEEFEEIYDDEDDDEQEDLVPVGDITLTVTRRIN